MIGKGVIKPHKLLWVAKECGYAILGKFKRKDNELEVTSAISEFDFYCLYLSIVNITLTDKMTESQIVVMSFLMTKNNDYTLSFDGKGNRLIELAEELKGISKNTIGLALKKLKERGFLVENDDKMTVPCAKLQGVRGSIKKQIEDGGYAEFDYLFKCFIK